METLKEKFEALAHRIQSSGKPAAAWFPQFTPVTLLNAENWWEALAVCEYALDTHEDEALTAGFFELIFSAYDCNVEVDLNEEEYAYWWEKVISVCDRVAVFNGAGWSQKGKGICQSRQDVAQGKHCDAKQQGGFSADHIADLSQNGGAGGCGHGLCKGGPGDVVVIDAKILHKGGAQKRGKAAHEADQKCCQGIRNKAFLIRDVGVHAFTPFAIVFPLFGVLFMPFGTHFPVRRHFMRQNSIPAGNTGNINTIWRK